MSARLPTITLGSTDLLRLERASLLARYDHGALASAVFAVVKKLEVEIAWSEHASTDPRRSADQPPNA